MDFPLVYTTLHDSPDLVINWIEIWTVWRPQIWRNEVWCFSTLNLHSFTQTSTLVLVLQDNAATKLSYGGKFFIVVMSHFFLIPTFKEFKKSNNICQSYSKNKRGPVFTRDSIYAIARICYRPSVCPSVRRVDNRKTVEVRITKFSSYDSPNPLVFAGQVSSRNSKQFPPSGSLKEGWGRKILRFSIFKREYLENGSRYG